MNNIRNPDTRRAYGRAIGDFLAWYEQRGLASIADLEPFQIGAYVETLTRGHSAPTAKQSLAAIRVLFDWLVTGQIVPTNPAASVRGPKYAVKVGKTPGARPHRGARASWVDGLFFRRVGAALAMKVEDVYVQNFRVWVRLPEKGGKRYEMPCHHNLETYLHASSTAAGSLAIRRDICSAPSAAARTS